MLNSVLLNVVHYNTGEIYMLIPIAYAGQDNHGIYVVIGIVIILILRYLYKRGEKASPTTSSHTTSLEVYKNDEQIRKEEKKKRRQTAEWKKKVRKLSILQKGDNQAKISNIIGKPDSIRKEEEESGQEAWVYDCGLEGKRIITFKDGFIEKIEVKY